MKQHEATSHVPNPEGAALLELLTADGVGLVERDLVHAVAETEARRMP
jgi:hypothetical protein